jgi:Ala-tRNA(Pro) deacylase
MTVESLGTLTSTRAEALAAYLEGEGVPCKLIEHKPTMSAVAEAGASNLSPDQVAKTIVLHDGPAYFIAAIPASDRLDLHKLRDLLGATRHLRLASEEEIEHDFPSFETGAIPPFGPIMPAAEVIDSALMPQRRILCPAGDHRHSVLVDPQEVRRIASAKVADICQD